MGCDIHIVIEEKDYLGKWKEVEIKPDNILPDSRYYKLWAFLFDVRDNLEWGFVDHPFSRRGLPKDCSIKEIIQEYNDSYCDFHSWTYIDCSEVEQIKWPEDLQDSYFKVFLEYVLPLMNTSVCNPTRMIICFDN